MKIKSADPSLSKSINLQTPSPVLVATGAAIGAGAT
jgi:hypothetical protein